jgi:hypothetical protein
MKICVHKLHLQGEESRGTERDCAEIADNFRQGCLQNGRKQTGRAASKLNRPKEIVWKCLTLRPYLPQMLQT